MNEFNKLFELNEIGSESKRTCKSCTEVEPNPP